MKKFVGLLLGFILLALPVCAKDLKFAQVSDARYSQIEGNNNLAKVIEDINKQKDIDFVVFTGDNISRPNKDDLKGFLKKAKKLHAPFYIVIGDKEVNKHKDLSKKDYMKLVHKKVRKHRYDSPNYTFEKSGVLFIVADGAKDVIPSTSGFYKDNVLDWIDANLALNSDKNVIIIQHFPLIPPAQRENYYTFKPDNYLALLGRYKNVKAVVAGHFGVNKEKTVNGIVHISTASVPYYRVIDVIDCDTPNPSIWAQIKEVK